MAGFAPAGTTRFWDGAGLCDEMSYSMDCNRRGKNAFQY
jgi:hypothetical protein